MTKNKTIGNRIISVLSAWTLFFSMFNSMENLFVRAGETEPEEMITDFIPEIPETTEKPDLLEIPAIDDEEDLVLPEENFSDEGDELADNPSELKQVSVPMTSVKSMASATKSYTVTSDANYSEHTPEYYYQQYALKGFLNKFTLQYLDIDTSKGDTIYHIERNTDFTLHYAIDLSMGELPIQKGSLKIKVPAKLFDFRDGTEAVLKNDSNSISVREILLDEDGNMFETDGTLATGNKKMKILLLGIIKKQMQMVICIIFIQMSLTLTLHLIELLQLLIQKWTFMILQTEQLGVLILHFLWTIILISFL